jgi:hypothetical protein
MRTTVNPKPISEINDLRTQGKVELRPEYQRRPVWSFKNKVYLIDTILQGLPIPKFFIKISIDNHTGKTIYEVVDGQQRLTALFEFISGKTMDGKDFILSKKQHPKPETFSENFEGLTFKSLPENLLSEFWRYKLSLEELEDANEQEIKDMFIRLNLSGSKLNNQELRNAAYNGDFKIMVYEVTEEFDDFFVENKILSTTDVKRMIDAEFVSELFGAMMKGLQDKKKNLDKIYAEYDSMDDSDISSWKKTFKSIITLIQKIMVDDIITTRFKNKNDFYSLFYVIFDLTSNKNYKITTANYSKIKDALIDLSKNVFLESTNPELVKYYEGAVNAGDTMSNRKYRNTLLTNLLEPFCIDRDKRRHFSDFEKQFLWHTKKEKKCGICGQIINNYTDYQLDHITPWDLGGETNLSNAQLAHETCNKSKGNR